MPVDTTVSLLTVLRRQQLLEPAQLDELTHLAPRFPDPRALARELLTRGWLTPFQLNQLFQGRNLVMGGYVLLERLGEGGMGKVFKARHQKLNRIVALKVIKSEHTANDSAARRFAREIEVAAKLSHPNVIQAFDADQHGDDCFFVMEYVEGIDLSCLVRKNGPLPVAQGCDCIRQAALGLQHAHERGMIHRDVKPSNLLLTARDGVIKVLDLGLARPTQTEGAQDLSSTLTQVGAIIGTPDFISPEQSRSARTADGRADLYSLGCTFYYLLTGQVPFPGGNITEKLLKHHLDTPKPLPLLRPDVPAAVAGVVERLMAKRPEDRFKTAAEVAAYLAELLGGGANLEAIPMPAATPALPREPFASLTPTLSGLELPTKTHRPRSRPKPQRELWWGLGLGVAILVGLILWGALGGSRPATPSPEDQTPGAKPNPSAQRAENVLAMFEKRGAKGKRDDSQPGKPIVGLDLKNCRLQEDEAELLECFTELRSLSMFQVAGLADTVLKSVRGLTHLRYLDLTGTGVSNDGLALLSGLTELEALDLTDTKVGAPGLVHLSKLPNLRQLVLARTPIDDPALSRLPDLAKLEVLRLNQTRVSDKGLAQLSRLPNLTTLDLTRTQVSAEGLPHLKKMEALRSLIVTGTRLSSLESDDLQEALPRVKVKQ